jgi:hypothetical protein
LFFEFFLAHKKTKQQTKQCEHQQLLPSEKREYVKKTKREVKWDGVAHGLGLIWLN